MFYGFLLGMMFAEETSNQPKRKNFGLLELVILIFLAHFIDFTFADNELHDDLRSISIIKYLVTSIFLFPLVPDFYLIKYLFGAVDNAEYLRIILLTINVIVCIFIVLISTKKLSRSKNEVVKLLVSPALFYMSIASGLLSIFKLFALLIF